MIGGACGALIAGWTGIGATAYGVTGLFGYLITTDDTLQYTCDRGGVCGQLRDFVDAVS